MSATIRTASARFDVTGSVPTIDEHLSLAATIVAPARPAASGPQTIVMCTPGGSLSKELFHLQRPGYSMLAALAESGVVGIAMDHLGTGESTRPSDGDLVGLREMSDANAAAAWVVRELAANGELVDGLPPSQDVRLVGFGHSLGGYSTIIQQGTHRCYDAVGVLGASNLYLEKVFQRHPDQDNLTPAELREWVKTLINAHGNDLFADPYMRVDRAHQDWQWYWEDVSPEIKALDPETVLPRNAAIDGVTPQFTAGDAARIDVPVFLGFAERDVSPNPHLEPSTYPASPDVTLSVFPRSGHIHNLSTTRALLWRRIVRWLDAL